jgi:hypothetical protein
MGNFRICILQLGTKKVRTISSPAPNYTLTPLPNNESNPKYIPIPSLKGEDTSANPNLGSTNLLFS